MYNHGSLWVYESPPLSHSLSYELPDLGDHPPIHDGRVSDHIDHHRFIPSSPYTYNPYAPTHYWPQHPQPPQPYLDVYPPPTHYSPHMPRGDVAVPPARRHTSDARPDANHRAPPSPTIPPMTRSPSHSTSSIDRSATSSIPPATTSPSPHLTNSPRMTPTHHAPFGEDGTATYTYPPPRPRDAHPSSSYSYHPSVHPSHRYPHYHSSSVFKGSTASLPPPPTTVPSQATSSHPRNLFVHPPPLPGQPTEVIHTDDAATKLSDRVRRRCFNCCTTETSTWRRSSLNPGKVLCNKCGLFERTHSRPRPEQFPHKRGPITTTQKAKAMPAVASPPMVPQPASPSSVPSVAPHHYDHPSLAPLRSRAESQKSPRMDSLPAIKSLLQSPAQTSKLPSPPRPESKHSSLPSSARMVLAVDGDAARSHSPKPRLKHSARRSRSPIRPAA